MKIAAIQLCSALDPQTNLDKIQDFIDQAKKESDIEAVFLPEVFYSMSDGTEATPYLVEKDNEHYRNIQKLAQRNKVYLIGGTAATVNPNGKVLNRTYNFSPEGIELTNYDKIHLFTVDMGLNKSNTVVDETVVYGCGSEPKILDLNETWKVGLGICFDVRFPELYRKYFTQGANLMTVASAFTKPTGNAHWEVLCRARAIENQSYVVAVGQWGDHNEKIKTYGHTMIVSPWGEVIANVGEGEGFILADLDISEVQKVRARLNVKPKLKTI